MKKQGKEKRYQIYKRKNNWNILSCVRLQNETEEYIFSYFELTLLNIIMSLFSYIFCRNLENICCDRNILHTQQIKQIQTIIQQNKKEWKIKEGTPRRTHSKRQ